MAEPVLPGLSHYTILALPRLFFPQHTVFSLEEGKGAFRNYWICSRPSNETGPDIFLSPSCAGQLLPSPALSSKELG